LFGGTGERRAVMAAVSVSLVIRDSDYVEHAVPMTGFLQFIFDFHRLKIKIIYFCININNTIIMQ
jgi:hypothetical protein